MEEEQKERAPLPENVQQRQAERREDVSAAVTAGGGTEMEMKEATGEEAVRDTPDLQEAPQLSGSRPDIRDTDSIVAVASTERLMESWVLREGMISSAIREGVLREGLSETQRDMMSHLIRQIEELKAKSETSRMNSELLHEQQEKKYQDAVNEIRSLKEQRKEAIEKYDALQKNVSKYSGNAGKLRDTLHQQQSTIDELQRERSDLLTANAKQQSDIERLMEQLKDYSQRSISMNSQICGLQAKLGDVETEKHRVEMAKGQLETRLQLAEGSAKWSQGELEKKKHQLNSLRSQMDTEIVTLRSEADREKAEVRLLHEQLNASRKQVQSLVSQVEEHTGKMREIESTKNQEIRDLEASLETQTALTKSYNESLDRIKKQAQKREGEVEVLHEALQKEKAAAVAREKTSSKKIQELEKRLKSSAKELQEAKKARADQKVPQVTPNFAEGSETEKQVKMFEMFNANQKLRLENSQLNRALKAIQREIARKEPLMKEQEAKYYRLCSTNKDLGEKLQNTLLENDQFKSFNSRLREKLSALTKERKELQMKLRVVTKQNIDLMESQELKHPSGIIRENPLTERCEKYEKQLSMAEKFKEKAAKTEELLLLVKSFKSQNIALRDENYGLKDQIQRQSRKASPLPTIASAESAGDSKPAATDDISRQMVVPATANATSLTEIKAMHERYVKEKSLIEKQLHEDNGKLKQRLSELKFKLTKAEMEVKYAAVQQKRDGETLSGYRKEIGILRKQNSDLSSSVVQHQTKIQGLVKDLRADRAKLEEGQSNLARAKSELRIVKESEQRLSRECAALMEEKQRSVALMATLDKIQTSLRKKDEESHRSVLQEKKEMHAELEAVRERYAKAQVEADNKLRARELECEALRKKAEAHAKQASVHEAKFHTTDKIRIELAHKLEKLEAKVPELEKQLEAAKKEIENEQELRKRMLQGDPESKRRHELEEEVKALTEENKLITNSMAESQKHAEKFKQLVSDSEKALREHTESRALERASLKKQIEGINSQRENLAKRVEELVIHCRNSDREVENLKDQLSEAEKKATKEVAEAQRARKLAEKSLEAAMEEKKRFQEEASKYAKVAKEANERYERELFLHVEKAKQLREVGKREEEALSLKSAAEALAKNWEEKASLAQSEVSQAEAAIQAERDAAEAKTEVVRRENELLQSQMESLAAQVENLRSSAETSALLMASERADGVEEEEAAERQRAIRELRELQSMAVREKEQLQLKLTRALQTAARAEAMLKNEKRALKEAREEVARLSASKAGREAYNAEEYALLEQKIHNMRLLKESNETLREQGERNKERADAAEKRASELEAKAEPLRKEAVMLRARVEFLESEKRLLEQDNERWKQRNMQLLDKYQMVDAQVHADLKQRHEKEKSKVEEQLKELEKLQTVQKELVEVNANFESLQSKIASEKAKLEEKDKEAKRRLSQARGWKRRHDTVEKQLKELKKQTDELKKSSGVGGQKVKELERRCIEFRTLFTDAIRAMETSAAQNSRRMEEMKEKFNSELKQKGDVSKKSEEEKARLLHQFRERLKKAQQKISDCNKRAKQLKTDFEKKLKHKDELTNSYLSELVTLRREVKKKKSVAVSKDANGSLVPASSAPQTQVSSSSTSSPGPADAPASLGVEKKSVSSPKSAEEKSSKRSSRVLIDRSAALGALPKAGVQPPPIAVSRKRTRSLDPSKASVEKRLKVQQTANEATVLQAGGREARQADMEEEDVVVQKGEMALTEQKRKAAELAEQKRKEAEIAEQKRKVAEIAEQKRKEAEIAEKKKREAEIAEQQRKEAEQRRKEAEQRRKEAEMLKEKRRQAARIAAQKKKEAKIAEQKRKEAEIAARRKVAEAAEQRRKAAEAAEQRRKVAELAEQKRLEEERTQQQRRESELAEQQKRKQEELAAQTRRDMQKKEEKPAEEMKLDEEAPDAQKGKASIKDSAGKSPSEQGVSGHAGKPEDRPGQGKLKETTEAEQVKAVAEKPLSDQQALEKQKTEEKAQSVQKDETKNVEPVEPRMEMKEDDTEIQADEKEDVGGDEDLQKDESGEGDGGEELLENDDAEAEDDNAAGIDGELVETKAEEAQEGTEEDLGAEVKDLQAQETKKPGASEPGVTETGTGDALPVQDVGGSEAISAEADDADDAANADFPEGDDGEGDEMGDENAEADDQGDGAEADAEVTEEENEEDYEDDDGIVEEDDADAVDAPVAEDDAQGAEEEGNVIQADAPMDIKDGSKSAKFESDVGMAIEGKNDEDEAMEVPKEDPEEMEMGNQPEAFDIEKPDEEGDENDDEMQVQAEGEDGVDVE